MTAPRAVRRLAVAILIAAAAWTIAQASAPHTAPAWHAAIRLD